MAVFRWIILVIGAAGLVFIIWSNGVQKLLEDLVAQGWAIVPYLAMTGVENTFHTLGSKWCFSRDYRKAMPTWRLFFAYQTSYALNLVTPTAEIGGEIARAMIFEKYVPGSQAASAVIIHKFVYSIARMIVAGSFAGMTVLVFPLTNLAAWPLAIGSGLTLGALLLFVFLQVKGWFGPALLRVAWITGKKSQDWIRSNVGELDRRLREYYRDNKADLFIAIFWEILGFATGTLQKWYLMIILLSTLTPAPEVTVLTAMAVWGITNLLDMIFFFVTGGMAVHEGGHQAAFEAVGLPGEKGVALSLVARVDQLFWIAVGIAAYMIEMAAKKKSHETPDRQR